MAVEFKNSVTKDNLMRAFAGESQARNRYTFAASCAEKQKQQALAQIFKYTADQEKEHAEVFYHLLTELAGETIHVDGSYPVDISQNLAELLRMAQHNEYQEHDDVYKSFGDKAKEEGLDNVAAKFYLISEIEKTHGDRFGRLAELIESGKLHVSDVKTGWICLNCGHIYEGEQVPEKCPVCESDRGYFIRLEFAPFAKGNCAK